MDFVPPSPSATAYERYVSESDTDGEGDTLSKRESSRDWVQPARQWGRFKTVGPFPRSPLETNGHNYHAFDSGGSGSSSSEQGQQSIFAKFASWSVGGSRERNTPTKADPDKGGGYNGGIRSTTAQESGLRRKDGIGDESASNPTALQDKSDASLAAASLNAVASRTMWSTSGLEGLKNSLVLDDHEQQESAIGAERTKFGGNSTGGGAGGDHDHRHRERSRGLWKEAANGELDALAAALGPEGNGDIHATTPDGWTALHSAANAGKTAAAALLLKKGASSTARARNGWTPLHLACMRGRSHAVKALVSAGADANARSLDQRTPLHFACEAGSSECVRELLLAGAAANVSDQDARTPLHFACIDGSTECVRRLLRAGASPVPPDAWGRDPAAVARQLGREGPLRLLEAFKSSAGPGSGSGARGSASASTAGLPLENGAAENERRSARTRKARFHGDRWVVMNEGGRMLERVSGKVALFRSMAAAADWANGLEIKSGSFQVAEVSPSMREAFEEEVQYEITGGGTISEEEEEEQQDPQWTRYRRQRAAAAAARVGQGREKQGAWTSVQKREEDKERARVAAVTEKLRQATEERDMHREKATSLEKALENVLKECELAATAIAAASHDPGQQLVAEEAAITEAMATGETTTMPEVNLTPEVPSQRDLLGSHKKIARGDTRVNGGSSGDISESETDGEVEEDEEMEEGNDIRSPTSGSGSTSMGDTPLVLFDASPNWATAESSATNLQTLSQIQTQGQGEGQMKDEGTTNGPADRENRLCMSQHGRQAEKLDKVPESEANTATHGKGEDGVGLGMEHGPVDKITRITQTSEAGSGISGPEVRGSGIVERNQDIDDDEATRQKLATWLSHLQIRRFDAERYARRLVEDGFDSGEALRGIREEELVQYGMKKGHARLVVRTLAEGCNL